MQRKKRLHFPESCDLILCHSGFIEVVVSKRESNGADRVVLSLLRVDEVREVRAK